MSLIDISNTIKDGYFVNRVEASMLKAAVAIVGEDGYGVSASKTHKRHTLGVKVLSGGFLIAFTKSIASQVGDVADPNTISDTSIDSATSAVWNDIAGIKFDE